MKGSPGISQHKHFLDNSESLPSASMTTIPKYWSSWGFLWCMFSQWCDLDKNLFGISFFFNISEVKEVSHSEELVLNTVSTLNNLSFYNDAESIVQQRQVQITESKPTITIFVLKNNCLYSWLFTEWLAWGNGQHFATAPLAFPAIWRLSSKHRNSIPMTCHCPDSDWLKQFFQLIRSTVVCHILF